MTWQDVVLTLCQAGFLGALIPSIVGTQKPEISTSVTTGILLVSMAITFSTLSLWGSAGMTALVAIGWFVLAVQGLRRRGTTD